MTDEKQAVGRIWVGVAQGAEITGLRKEYLRELALSIWAQPAEERPVKIRFRSKRYEFWLPDLIPYIENSDDASDFPKIDLILEPTWVTTAEAAEITGYNRQYVMKLAKKVSQRPEADREIKIRRRPGYAYELWLPDLIAYIEGRQHGPQPKRIQKP